MSRTPGDTRDILTSVGLTAVAACAARALDAVLASMVVGPKD